MLPSNLSQRKRLPRWLILLSNLTLAYPLLFPAALYSQWLLSWAILGHPPIEIVNDPKDIDGASWMFIISGLAYLGSIPMACIGITSNVLYLIKGHLTRIQTRRRILLFLVLWLGTWLLLWLDPGSILSWWFD